MQLVLRVSPLALLLTGCTLGGLSPVEDTGGSGTDSGTNLGDTAAQSYDPWAGLAAEPGCEDVSGTPVAGATGYFVGDLQISGTVVEGVEEWVLFANQAWRQSTTDPGHDCAMVWNIFGRVDEPTDCVACTHELVLEASFDANASDCTQLFEDSEGVDFNTRYFVQARPSGEASFTFTSGNDFADGVFTDVRAAYASEFQCNWF